MPIKINMSQEKIDHLKHIHYKLCDLIDSKDWKMTRCYMRQFTGESDINEIKTILIITKGMKEHPEIKDDRSRIYNIYKNQCDTLGIQCY